MTRSRVTTAAIIVVALIAALAYLRDPPWLSNIEQGFRPWEVERESGARYRWIGGHASFFVPADATSLTIPLRTTFGPNDPPIIVTMSIDDRPSDRMTLTDDRWHTMSTRITGATSRRLRRIDLRAGVVREGNRSVQVADAELAFR